MDEVNIILMCSGVVLGIIVGCSWYLTDKITYETFCSMRGYTPVRGFEDI